MVIHKVFEALAGICKSSDKETIYECLNAAKDVAIERLNYPLAASLRDLRIALTNDFKPKATADNLKQE